MTLQYFSRIFGLGSNVNTEVTDILQSRDVDLAIMHETFNTVTLEPPDWFEFRQNLNL